MDYEYFKTNGGFDFVVTLEAKDRGIVGVKEGEATTAKLKATHKVTITIKDVNDPPEFTASSVRFQMPEDEDAGKNIGLIAAFDQDGNELTYSIRTGGEDNVGTDPSATPGVFDIDKEGRVFVNKAMLVTAGDVMILPIIANDGIDETVKKIEVEILPPSNKAPVINDAQRQIDENMVYEPIGFPLTCTDHPRDVERGQRLTFAIVDGNDKEWFEINPFTGQLQVTATAKIDFEAGISSVKITVECKDDGVGELSDTAIVTITVKDVNEDPNAKDSVGFAEVPENRPINYIVNGKFEEGKNIGGMLRCQSKFACEHMMGEGEDKYFPHVSMDDDCTGCSIQPENKWSTGEGEGKKQGYVLRLAGPTDGSQNVYKAWTGTEMVVSYPATVKVSFWVKVSADYTGNTDVFGVECYNSAPPADDWEQDKCGAIDNQAKQLPTERDTWVFVGAKMTIGLKRSLDHPDGKVDLDGDKCDDPREDETARFMELSFKSHVGSNEGTIMIHDIRVFDDTAVGDVSGFKDVDADTKLAYWILPIQKDDDAAINHKELTAHQTPFRLQKLDEKEGYDASLTIEVNKNAAELGLVLNYEKLNTITLIIKALDDGDTTKQESEQLAAYGAFTVHVCNRNDPPVVADQSRGVFENTDFGTKVGAPLWFVEEDAKQRITFTVETGNIPKSVAQNLAPAKLSFDGTGFAGQQAGWYDVMKFLVLGGFGTSNRGACLIVQSQIGGIEGTLGDTWFPKSGQTTAGKTWMSWDTGSGGLLNFQRRKNPTLGNRNYVTGYAMTYVYSDEEKTLTAAIGSDDGMIVWVNGKQMFQYNGCRGGRRAQNTFSIKLLQGENTIMFKVHDKWGGWNARFSLASMKGLVATNVRISDEERLKMEAGGNYHNEKTFWFDEDEPSQMIVFNDKYMDHELQSEYNLIVRATDNGIGSLSDTARIVVQVKDVNEPPELEGSLKSTVNENKCGGGHPSLDTCSVAYILGNVGAVDYEDNRDPSLSVTYHVAENPLFDMSANGELLIKAGQALDYETNSKHEVSFAVRDSAGLVTFDTYIVNVQDVNDPPTLNDQDVYIREDAKQGDKTSATQARAMSKNSDKLDVSDDDKPAQTIQYRIKSQPIANMFTIGLTDGQLRLGNAALNYEAREGYTIVVESVDCGGVAGACGGSAWTRKSNDHMVITAEIGVRVVDVNEAPVMPDQTLYVSEDLPEFGPVGAPIDAADPDKTSDQKLVFTVKSGNELGYFAIEACSGQLSLVEGKALDFEGIRVFKLDVSVTDKGNLGDRGLVTVVVMDENEAPVMPAGGLTFDVDEGSKEGELVGKMDMSKVFDPDYPEWTTRTSGGVTCDTWDSTATSDVSKLRYSLTSRYCRAAEGRKNAWCYAGGKKSNCGHQDVEYVITGGNGDKSFAIDSETGSIFVGSGAKYLDFEKAKQRLLTVKGCDRMSVNGVKVQPTEFQWSNAIYEEDGRYEHTPMCTETFVMVNVKDTNDAPKILGRSLIARNVNENSGSGTKISTAMQATDDDGDRVYWKLVNGHGLFAVDKNTGELRVQLQTGAHKLNFESTKKYKVQVQAFDRSTTSTPGVMISTKTIIINVNDMNESPSCADQTLTISEDAPKDTVVGTPPVLTDEDTGQVYLWQIFAGDSNKAFNIDATTGQLTVSETENGLDYETTSRRQFSLTIKVRDLSTASQNGPTSNSASCTIKVDVTDANDTPLFQIVGEAVRFLPEDAGVGDAVLGRPISAIDPDQGDTITYSLDPAASSPFFDIDSGTGTLVTSSSATQLDYEMDGPSEYSVTVIATDNAKGTGVAANKLSTSQVVTIKLKDQNEPPLLENQVREVSEIALNGQFMGGPLEASDKDLSGGQKLVFSLRNTTDSGPQYGNNPDNLFAITPYGQLYLNRGPTEGNINPYLDISVPKYEMTVCVEDSGFSAPNEQDSQKTCKLLTINVLDANNPPLMISTVAFTLIENSPVGTVIGKPVSGTDPDADVLTYKITQGNEADLFEISSNTAQLKLKKADVNYERKALYRITVQATDDGANNDGKGLLSSATIVEIHIIDINEAPKLIRTACFIEENSPEGSICQHGNDPELNKLVQDEDGDEKTNFAFDLGGNKFGQKTKDGFFRIDVESGMVSCANNLLNYEETAARRYKVVVYDKKGLRSNSVAFATMIQDVNDQPVLPSGVIVEVNENVATGTRVGGRIVGSDQDFSDTLAYYIEAENVWAKDIQPGDKMYVPGVSAGLSIPGSKGTRQVSLTVDAAQSARIQLRSVSDDDRRSYDIIVGENGNTQSRIARCDTNGQCEDCVIFPVPPKNGGLTFDFRTSKMYESNSSNCDPTRTDDACGAWRSNAFAPPVLSVGDFGPLDAAGNQNCDDKTSDATCETTAWAGPRKDAYLEMEMNDKLTFSVSSIEIPQATAPSRAFQYSLETTNLAYHVDFDKDDFVESANGGFQIKNRAPGVSATIANLKIEGGSVAGKVGNQVSLFAKADKSTNGGGGSSLMGFGPNGAHKGSTSYNRRNKAQTNNNFRSKYGNDWEIIDDNVPSNQWSGWMYSTPSSWSVACGSKECAIRQRSNIHAWCKSSDDCRWRGNGKKYNWRQEDAKGTVLKYRGPGSSSWTDYKFKYKARSLDNDWIGVSFRMSDRNNYYQFEMGKEISARRLKKYVNGQVTVLDEVHPSGCKPSGWCKRHNRWSHWGCSPRACHRSDNNKAYVRGNFYEVEIRVENTNIQVWIGTCGRSWTSGCNAMTKLFDVDDSSLSKGSIGLTSRANHFGEWKNIQVVSNAAVSGVGLLDTSSDSNAMITGAQDMTLTSWIYKDSTSDNNKLDYSIYGNAVRVAANTGEFYTNMNTGGWNGKYGAKWNDMAGGWNEVTMTYKKSNNRVNFFLNGKRKGSERTLGLGSNFKLKNVGSGYNGHLGLIYAYKSLSDASTVLDRFTDVFTHFNGETVCTGAKLQYTHPATGVWTTIAPVSVGSRTKVPDAPVAKMWRVAGFSDTPGFCVMGMPKIEGTKSLPASAVDEARILRANNQVPMWVSWTQNPDGTGMVRVGTGSNPAKTSTTAMECADSNFLPVQYLALGSANSGAAKFRDVTFEGIMPDAYSEKTERLVTPAGITSIFGIEKSTGQIYVKSAVLDFETAKSFSVMVKVTDGKLSDSQSVIVNINNVAEPPHIRKVCGTNSEVETCATIAENSPVGTKIGLPVNVIDQDEADYSAKAVVPDSACAQAMSTKTLEILQSAPMPSNRPVDLTSQVVVEDESPNSQGTNFQVARGNPAQPIVIAGIALLPAGETGETANMMTDGRRDSGWMSKDTDGRATDRQTANSGTADGSDQEIEIDFGSDKVCVGRMTIQFAGLQNAGAMEIDVLNSAKDTAINVYSGTGLIGSTEDRVDDLTFEPACGRYVRIALSSPSDGYFSIREITMYESEDVLFVGAYRTADTGRSPKNANLPISMNGDLFALTSLTIYTPPGGVGCGSFLFQTFDGASGKWENVLAEPSDITGEETLDLRSVASSTARYRVIGFGEKCEDPNTLTADGLCADPTATRDFPVEGSKSYCTVAFKDFIGYRTSVPTLGTVMSTGAGSTTEGGLFTDGTDVWVANGDGTQTLLSRTKVDAACIKKASRAVTASAFKKRSNGWTLTEQESTEACESAASFTPSDPAAAGLAADEEGNVYFINADGSKNKVQKPSKRCADLATRGLDVLSFPSRNEGFTLSPDDSKRACASPAYDSRVVLHFPDLPSCKQALAGVQLKVYVFNPGSAMDICPLKDAKWNAESLTYAVTGAKLSQNQQTRCRKASQFGFNTGQVGWQTIDITNFVMSVQQGGDNTGVLLQVNGPDGVGFFSSEYEDAYFRPRLEITYAQTNNIRWRIEGGNVGGVFKMDATSGQLSVGRDGILDFEDDITGRDYELVVSATDSSGLTTFGRFQVTTIDVNESPASSKIENREVNENVGVGTLVGNAIAASDPDLSNLPHGTLTWDVETVYGATFDYPIETLKNQYKEVSDKIFTIGESDGQIYVGSPILNREGDINIYLVDVRIRDQGTPPLDILSQVTIQIKDVNERPVMADQKRQIRENSPIDSTAGAPLVASDVDLDQELDFTIQDNNLFKVEGCSGKLSVKNYLSKSGAFLMNYEDAINSFEYTITVTDSKSNSISTGNPFFFFLVFWWNVF